MAEGEEGALVMVHDVTEGEEGASVWSMMWRFSVIHDVNGTESSASA